jgi:hypothetical protein
MSDTAETVMYSTPAFTAARTSPMVTGHTPQAHTRGAKQVYTTSGEDQARQRIGVRTEAMI